MDDMSDGSAVKIWRGFTFGSLMSTAATLATFSLGVIGMVWFVGALYFGTMQRLVAVETAVARESEERRAEHQETIGLFCTMMKQITPGYVCLITQRGDAPPARTQG